MSPEGSFDHGDNARKNVSEENTSSTFLTIFFDLCIMLYLILCLFIKQYLSM